MVGGGAFEMWSSLVCFVDEVGVMGVPAVGPLRSESKGNENVGLVLEEDQKNLREEKRPFLFDLNMPAPLFYVTGDGGFRWGLNIRRKLLNFFFWV